MRRASKTLLGRVSSRGATCKSTGYGVRGFSTLGKNNNGRGVWRKSEKVYVLKSQQPVFNFKRTYVPQWHNFPPEPVPSEDIDVVAFEQRLSQFKPDGNGLTTFLSSGVPAIIGTNEAAYTKIFLQLIALGQLDYVPDVLIRARDAGLELRANLVEPIFYQLDRILPDLEPGDYLDDAINMVHDVIHALETETPEPYEKQYRLLYELLDVDPKYLSVQRNLLDDLIDISDNVGDLWMRCAVKTCAADEDQQFELMQQQMVEWKVKLDLQYFYELFCVYEKQGRHKQMALIASEIIEQAKDKITPEEREDIRARLEKVGVKLDDWITVPELKSTYKKPEPAASSAPSSGAPTTTPPPAAKTSTGAPSAQAPTTSQATPGAGAKPVGTTDSSNKGPSGPPGTPGSPKQNEKASPASVSGETKSFGNVQSQSAGPASPNKDPVP
eukprot:TRINITY_DN26767_c0_g1_i1.p1 TRINITY_DN26767_c0_g1~~TRINITY_DN26767_c0_g1_i1.p1  ORF type:complete len:441 (-),score=101.40 TRINITY_DN26767_c0_g1_i1:30-1352(-)